MADAASDWKGKVAVITGAAMGIGYATAELFARHGAHAVLMDVDSARLTEATQALRRSGLDVSMAVADVSDEREVASAVEDAIQRAGRIDVLVNNAGFASGGGDIRNPAEAEIDRLLNVHFKGAVGAMSAAFADMARRGWGRIVNTVSEVALDARFVNTGFAYGSAKAAVWSATLAAARAGEPLGVTVNAVSPGARTRMNAALLDAGFRGQAPGLDLSPEHVARVVAWLVSDEAGDVTGRIIHAAAGQVREYLTTRSGHSELAGRIQAALQDG